MLSSRVALTGATGFIGGRIFDALRQDGRMVRSFARTDVIRADDHVVIDLEHSPDLAPSLEGCEVLIHAASRTSGSASEIWTGNAIATERLITAACSAGVGRIVYVSTSGVYGRSSGFFGDPKGIPRNALSGLSRARRRAEDIVLAAGGTIIRPHIVYGYGDKWVAPALVSLMTKLGAWIDGRDVQLAAIRVDELGRALSTLIDARSLPSVLHASALQPVPVGAIVAAELRRRRLPEFTRVIGAEEAWKIVAAQGVSRNAFEMVAHPSQMDSTPLWNTVNDLHLRQAWATPSAA